MKPFMDKDFLITTDTAAELFDHIKDCPIYDYHNHLSPRDIYERRRYDNITQLWLEGDHYKWRCMRVCGIDEEYVTGKASDYDKFIAFASVCPRIVGSPVYHWAHMELQRYFGIDKPLGPDTADEVWRITQDILQKTDTVELLNAANVRVLCTTDDPADTLEYHKLIASDGTFPFKVLPSFRPDRFLHIEQPAFTTAVAQLGKKYGDINSFGKLCCALKKSLDFFASLGCRVTDHGFIKFRYENGGDADAVFNKAMAGEDISEHEAAIFKGALLRHLASEYAERGMVMQLHLGPIRNNSPRLFECFGPDAGGDSIGEATDPFALGALLGDLEASDTLPKTILYNMHPSDSDMMATMAANFGARVQYGAAWWLNDHIRGINDQLDRLMETGALSTSVGMLTDSRSVTSFVRHEYYRRILCAKLGALVESGQYPRDMRMLKKICEDVACKNAAEFFGF